MKKKKSVTSSCDPKCSVMNIISSPSDKCSPLCRPDADPLLIYLKLPLGWYTFYYTVTNARNLGFFDQNLGFVETIFINTFRPVQNGCLFIDNIFKCIVLNENVWILIGISLKFVPRGPINNIPALVQIMAWRLPGDKPLSEPLMLSLLMHICITRPQWVNSPAKYINLLLNSLSPPYMLTYISSPSIWDDFFKQIFLKEIKNLGYLSI